jgi:3-oxoacyl-[acyl-carrier protein] reductase
LKENVYMKDCQTGVIGVKELNGRIAIVTGGAQGIGLAVAGLMAERGATVVISDINAGGARAAAEDLGCTALAGDISEMEYVERLVRFTVEKYKRIDILVNNAGIAGQVDILDISESAYDRLMSVNLKGPVFLSKLALGQMIKQRYGRIVNMASLAGERGGLFAGVHYSASKAGMIVLTKCLALKGGPYGVTANAVAPGLIETALAEKLQFNTDEIPLKRLGTPKEVAEVVAFLASDRAGYVSGCTVDVNGGQFMR